MSDENTTNTNLRMGGAPKPFETDVAGIPVVVAPPSWSIHSMEQYLPAPATVRENARLADLSSFVDYVHRFAEPSTIIKLRTNSRGSIEAEAIIDYHEAPVESVTSENPEAGVPFCAPRWGRHTATFTSQQTASWAAWLGSNGKVMRQADFAGFIYQNMVDIADPQGAEVLEIIQTLKATAKGEFRDMKDLHSGSVELVYRMKISASGGTGDQATELPQQIQLVLRPFYGGRNMELKADLVVRAPDRDGEPLMIGYQIYRLDDALEDMFEVALGELQHETGLPVYRCG